MSERFYPIYDAVPRSLRTASYSHRVGVLAEQILYRASKGLVARMHIYLCTRYRFVTSKTLGDQNIFRALVDARYGAMPETVKRKQTVESSTQLPLLECMTQLSCGKTHLSSAHEQRCVYLEGLPFLSLPTVELLQFCPNGLGQNDLLLHLVGIASLEHAELNPSTNIAVGIENIPYIESENFVLPQPRTEGDGKNHMISIPIPTQTGDLEKKTLLPLGKRPGGIRNIVDIRSHVDSFVDCYGVHE